MEPQETWRFLRRTWRISGKGNDIIQLMIKETLRIKNIGPLRDAKLDDIRPVMVLVGATGAGKSLILKILAMMRHVAKKQIIRRALKASGVTKSVFRLRRDTYLLYADIEHLIKDDSSIEYTLCDDEIECCVVLDRENFRTDISGLSDNDAIGPFMKIAFVSDSRNLVASWAKKGAVIQTGVRLGRFSNCSSMTFLKAVA